MCISIDLNKSPQEEEETQYCNLEDEELSHSAKQVSNNLDTNTGDKLRNIVREISESELTPLPEIDLNELLPHLEYAFLGKYSHLPVLISSTHELTKRPTS